MQFSITGLIYFAAFAQSVLFIAILIKKSQLNQPGAFLAMLIAVLAYKQLEGVIEHSELYRYAAHLMYWIPGAVLFMGPVYLAYVRSMAGSTPWEWTHWLKHLLPGLLLLTFFIPQIIVPLEHKVSAIEASKRVIQSPQLTWFSIFMLISWKAHFSAYLYTAWKKLEELEGLSEQQFSDDTAICINWQRKMI